MSLYAEIGRVRDSYHKFMKTEEIVGYFTQKPKLILKLFFLHFFIRHESYTIQNVVSLVMASKLTIFQTLTI